MNFFGLVKSPCFYTEMPTDNTDSVSMDFLITQTVFWPVEYQSTPVNTDRVARTGDMAHGRQVVYCYITYSVLASDIRGTSTLAAAPGESVD